MKTTTMEMQNNKRNDTDNGRRRPTIAFQASTIMFVLTILLSVSSSSARSIGGARSKVSQTAQPLFGIHHHNHNDIVTTTTARVASMGCENALFFGRATSLLRLRGGSSLGGGSGPSVRPMPSKTNNPFRKTKEPTRPSFRAVNAKDDDDDGKIKLEDYNDNEEEVREKIDAFLTRDSRNSFIARVYGILSIQLGFTALVCLLFGTYAPLTDIIRMRAMTGRTSPLLWLPLVGVFASTIAFFKVAVDPKARQKSPNKWWWLTFFTVGEAMAIGAISSLYQLRSVITAMGATALATVTVSMYTINQKNPKYDLSQWGATLSSWSMILLTYMMIGMAQRSGWLPAGFLPFSDMLYSGFAVCLFTLFLAYDTKLIVGGKHAKYQMNEKDYVFGAMTLYVDIVNIFLHLLQLMGTERE